MPAIAIEIKSASKIKVTFLSTLSLVIFSIWSCENQFDNFTRKRILVLDFQNIYYTTFLSLQERSTFHKFWTLWRKVRWISTFCVLSSFQSMHCILLISLLFQKINPIKHCFHGIFVRIPLVYSSSYRIDGVNYHSDFGFY